MPPLRPADGPDRCSSWALLPSDALAVVVNSQLLERRDVGRLRLVCCCWKQTVDNTLLHLAPNCSQLEQFLSLPQKFPLLTSLDVHQFDYKLFDPWIVMSSLANSMQPIVARLSAMPSLTSLQVSAQWACQVGGKAWARRCAHGVEDGIWSWDDPNVLQHSGLWLQQVLLLPKWMEQLKGLKQVAVLGQAENHEHGTLTSLLSLEPGSLAALTSLRLAHVTLGGLPCPPLFQLRRLESLQLQHCSLIHLPPLVSQLASLTLLDVSHNNLKELPCSISCLVQLSDLELHHNRLERLPSSASALTALTALRLSNNQLSSVPHCIPALSHLHILSLSHNWLRGVTDWCLLCCAPELQELELANVSDKSHVLALPGLTSSLTTLRLLDISDNLLGDSDSLRALSTLTGLTELRMAGLRLAEVPEAVWALTGLRCLHLSRNWLQELPPHVARLQGLSQLDLARNAPVRHLPVELGELSQLRVLSLSCSGVQHVPNSLAALSRLRRLDLSGNKMGVLPPAVAALTALEELVLAGCGVDRNVVDCLPATRIIWD